MTKPTREQLELLFDRDESVQEWVEDRLHEMASIKCPSIPISLRDFEISGGYASAEVWESRHCGRCSDEHEDSIEMSIDELLDSEAFIKRHKSEKEAARIAKVRRDAELAEQKKKAVAARELSEYKRLAEKYKDVA